MRKNKKMSLFYNFYDGNKIDALIVRNHNNKTLYYPACKLAKQFSMINKELLFFWQKKIVKKVLTKCCKMSIGAFLFHSSSLLPEEMSKL